jgi:hypothetical protein
MGLVPQTFTTEGGAIASYDFNDFAAGTGIQAFNAFSRDVSTSTNSFAITTATPYSNLILTSGAISVGNPLTINFDSEPFLLPRTVKGTATINVPYRVTNSSGSNNNYVWVQLHKFDGITATLIGQSSGAITSSASGTEFIRCLQIRDITQSSGALKSGEQLRLTVMIDAATAGNSPNAKIAHDPQNRTGDTATWPTTKLTAWVPFLLDA